MRRSLGEDVGKVKAGGNHLRLIKVLLIRTVSRGKGLGCSEGFTNPQPADDVEAKVIEEDGRIGQEDLGVFGLGKAEQVVEIKRF